MAKAFSKPNSAQEYYHLVTHELESTTETILGYYTLPNEAPFTKAACIHQYVCTQVGGRSSPREPFRETPIRPPAKTLSEGGNCEEQSILFASLLQPIPRVKARLLVVGRPNGSNHALTEIRAPSLSMEDASDHLIALHNQNPGITFFPERIQGRYQDRGDLWFPADPALSRFVGDLQSHKEKGFVNQFSNSWEWHQVHDVGPILE